MDLQTIQEIIGIIRDLSGTALTGFIGVLLIDGVVSLGKVSVICFTVFKGLSMLFNSNIITVEKEGG